MRTYDPVKARIYREKRKLDPNYKSKRRGYRNKYRESVKNNPDWREKERARGREYAAKQLLDPERKRKLYDRTLDWMSRNKPHLKKYDRAYRLKKNYNLTLEEYQKKRADLDEKCPICNNPLGVGAVDHNHTTGQVRDILCEYCNRWLGFIEKRGYLINPMLQYLEKWNNLAKQPENTEPKASNVSTTQT